ncbi:alpha/beta fold hydrolase [Nocardia sp. NPDC058518]|uniref:alpha/beta fold hydrolase n=1 Tax=Nocardia sp. NPDC058518 TaxID=3346534 RepID=UPI00365B550D
MSTPITVTTRYGEVVVHLSGRSPADAPGLLLLHANPGDHRDFDQIVPRLGETWALAAIDWPGYGASTVVDPDAITVDALGDVAVQVSKTLAQRGFGSLTVIGNSVGGYAAVRLAERAPDLVRGLVLVQSAGFAPRNLLTRAMFHLISRPSVARRFVVANARLYLGSLRNDGVRPLFERAREIPGDPVRLAVYRRLWLSLDDPRVDLPAASPLLPDLPVQVVWGRNDPTNPWLVNRRGIARALPESPVALLATRHEPFAEAPDLFLDAVREFLTTCAGVRQ